MIEQNKNWGLKSFIPLLTFLAVYLGAGVVFSLMGTENPFKQISREFAVLCGLTTVILLSRSRKNIDLNIDLVAKHCGEPGVMLMIMIFALAGAFSGAAEAGAAVIARLKADGMPYITATHDALNPRSGRVMEKLSMRYCYTYREQWQPKNIPVSFRLYQLNLDGDLRRVCRRYWDVSAEHWVGGGL